MVQYRQLHDFVIYYVHVIMLHPPTSRSNVMAGAHPLIYVTQLAASKEAWSSHTTIKCVTKSFTLPGEPSPQHQYAPNPKYVMDVKY